MITSSLKIMLWNKEIGRLSWDGRKGISYFEFNPSAISKFRTYAEECGVGQQWIAAVETCLNNHLSKWSFLSDSSSPSFEIDGIHS